MATILRLLLLVALPGALTGVAAAFLLVDPAAVARLLGIERLPTITLEGLAGGELDQSVAALLLLALVLLLVLDLARRLALRLLTRRRHARWRRVAERARGG